MLLRISLLATIALLLQLTVKGQSFQWAEQSEGNSGAVHTNSSTDNEGNQYIFGSLTGPFSFQGQTISKPTHTTIPYNSFLMKLDPQGKTVWLRKITARGEGLVGVENGVIYFVIAVTKESGPSPTLTLFGPDIIIDLNTGTYLVQYDTSGHFQWVKYSPLSAYNLFHKSAVTPEGDYCVMHYFTAKIIKIFDQNLYSLLPNTNAVNAGLVLLDKSGTPKWGKVFSSTPYDKNNLVYKNFDPIYPGISFDHTEDRAWTNDGYVYASHHALRYIDSEFVMFGMYVDHVNVGADTANDVMMNGLVKNGTNWMKIRFTRDGDIISANDYNDPDFNYLIIRSIYPDYPMTHIWSSYKPVATIDALYAATVFKSLTLPGGIKVKASDASDGIFIKVNNQNQLEWYKQLSGLGSARIHNNLVVDDKVYITGEFDYSLTIDHITIHSFATSSGFLAILDTSGKLLDLIQPQQDQGSIYESASQVDNFGHMYWHGLFSGLLIFGADTLDNQTSTNSLFVTRVGYCPATPVIALPDTNTVCVGSSLLLSVPDIYSKYQWFRDGLKLKDETHSSINATAGGVYRLVVDSGECRGISNPVVLLQKPAAELGDRTRTLCKGTSLKLWPGNNYPQILWSDGSTNNLLQVSQSGTYWVRVTDAYGCTSTDTITLNEVAGPDESIVLSGPAAFCKGSSVKLNVADGFADYQWFRNGQAVVGAIHPQLSTADTGNFVVRIINMEGCTAFTPSVHLGYLDPQPPVVQVSGPLTLCEGSSVTLSLAVGYTRIRWLRDGVEIPSATDRLLPVNASGRYSVQADSAGCPMASAPVDVTINPYPQVSLGEDRNICSREEIILQLDNTYSSIRWSTGDTGRQLIVRQTGEYWVEVENAFGCKATDTINIGIRQIGRPGIKPENDTLMASAALIWRWFYNGVRIEGAERQQYVPLFDGWYQVEIEDEYGCRAISDSLYFEGDANKEPWEDGGIKIYPNPVVDELVIEFYFGPNVQVKADIMITDGLGRVVHREQQTVNSNLTRKIVLNPALLADGVYFLQVRLNDFATTRKFVKAGGRF